MLMRPMLTRRPTQRLARRLESGELHVCVQRSPNGVGVHITLHGEWDIGTTGQMRAALTAVRSQGPTEVVVDLRGLTFIDVTGLVVLLELDAERERHGGTLTLIRGNAHVHRLFELAGVSDRLRLVGAPLSELLH